MVRVILCFWNLIFLSIGLVGIIGSVWILLKFRLDRKRHPTKRTQRTFDIIVRWRQLDVRIESPIAITADPLFVFIIIGAFTTVISFQVGIHRLLRQSFISVRESRISRWFWILPREHNNAYNLCLDTEFIIFDHFWNVSFGMVSGWTN